MLVPLIVPVDTPLWMLAVAVVFGVVIGKEVFGGTGMNILNPALTIRAFLFFAYPTWMSGDKVWVHGAVERADQIAGGAQLDAISGETILGGLAQGKAILGETASYGKEVTYSIADALYGFIPGSVGETSAVLILLGGLFLMMNLEFWKHLIVGGIAFGIVFMATDPVTASQTNKGKWIYGFLIGFISILIRVFNPAYPEGVFLAILLMNVFAPTIDHYVVQGNVKKRMKRLKLKTA